MLKKELEDKNRVLENDNKIIKSVNDKLRADKKDLAKTPKTDTKEVNKIVKKEIKKDRKEIYGYLKYITKSFFGILFSSIWCHILIQFAPHNQYSFFMYTELVILSIVGIIILAVSSFAFLGNVVDLTDYLKGD